MEAYGLMGDQARFASGRRAAIEQFIADSQAKREAGRQFDALVSALSLDMSSELRDGNHLVLPLGYPAARNTRAALRMWVEARFQALRLPPEEALPKLRRELRTIVEGENF